MDNTYILYPDPFSITQVTEKALSHKYIQMLQSQSLLINALSTLELLKWPKKDPAILIFSVQWNKTETTAKHSVKPFNVLNIFNFFTDLHPLWIYIYVYTVPIKSFQRREERKQNE